MESKKNRIFFELTDEKIKWSQKKYQRKKTIFFELTEKTKSDSNKIKISPSNNDLA